MAKAGDSKAPPAKKDAPKADAPKADDKDVKSRGPKGVALDAKITLLVNTNPKREGSKAKVRFENYKTGMTVQQALDAGITTPDLIYDASHSFIKIDGYNPTLIPAKPKKEPKPEAEKKDGKAGDKGDGKKDAPKKSVGAKSKPAADAGEDEESIE